MAAVFSAPLVNHAPKVLPRHSKPDICQATKSPTAEGSKLSPDSSTKSISSIPTTKPASDAINKSASNATKRGRPLKTGRWKRSFPETGLDAQSSERSTTDASEPHTKRTRNGSPDVGEVLSSSESRKRYLSERAAKVEFPTAEAAELTPKFLYDDPTLVIRMCLDCRIASRLLPIHEADKENQHLVINLCNICRAALKSHQRLQFFQHELPCFKRQQLREAKSAKKDLKKFVL